MNEQMAKGVGLLVLSFVLAVGVGTLVIVEPIWHSLLQSDPEYQATYQQTIAARMVTVNDAQIMDEREAVFRTQAFVIASVIALVWGLAGTLGARWIEPNFKTSPFFYYILYGVVPAFIAFYGWRNVHQATATRSTAVRSERVE